MLVGRPFWESHFDGHVAAVAEEHDGDRVAPVSVQCRVSVELFDGHVASLSVEVHDDVSDLDPRSAGMRSPDVGDLQCQIGGSKFQATSFVGVEFASPKSAVGSDHVQRFSPTRVARLSPAVGQFELYRDDLLFALQLQRQSTGGRDRFEHSREVAQGQHAVVLGLDDSVADLDFCLGGWGVGSDRTNQ